MAKKPVLTATHGPLAGKSFVVEDGFVIGRDETCEIVTEDHSTSRRHAKLTIEKEGVRVADLESANGLFVNERRVKSHFLRSGDIVVMGDTTFEFSIPVDPKARRRKFLLILLVIVGTGAAAVLSIVRQQQSMIARSKTIAPEFLQPYRNGEMGFECAYPADAGIWIDRDYPSRPWKDDIFGNLDPVLGNQMVTEKVVLDKYHLLRVWQEISTEWFEYIIYDVESYDGIAAFQDLSDLSLTDKSLPTRRPSAAQFDERSVRKMSDPILGDFEEGELIYPKGEIDPAGNDVEAYVRARCYVVGKRRYVVSVELNAKDRQRAAAAIDGFFETFKVIATTYPERDEKAVRQEGLALMSDGKAFALALTPNSQYKAFLRYCAAARVLKQLRARSSDHTEALSEANRLWKGVSTILIDKRANIREYLNRVRFLEARQLNEDFAAIVDDNDPTSTVDENDEWRQWYSKSKEEIIAIANRLRPGAFQ